MKDKVVIFIDMIAPKNKLQVDAIHQFGYKPFCFVTEIKTGSEAYFLNGGKQQELQTSFFKRCIQVLRFFKQNHNSIHHVELYPGGRFSFMYILLSRFFFLKTICIERGDLLYYHKNGYSSFTRFSMWLCYKFSSILWYRELYMKLKLEKIRTKGLVFLHNAIKVNDDMRIPAKERDIDFLWLNRVIPERKYSWFINALEQEAFSGTSNYLVGLLKKTNFSVDQEYVQKNTLSNLTLEEYSSYPSSFFKRARFFVLPADVVFANHALLEAMSYGVVPLISSQQGSELIVDNGINGFIFEHSPAGLQEAMEKAIKITDAAFELFSSNAAKKVREDFSEKKYIDSLRLLYKTLD